VFSRLITATLDFSSQHWSFAESDFGTESVDGSVTEIAVQFGGLPDEDCHY